jgi:hypothetical protein
MRNLEDVDRGLRESLSRIPDTDRDYLLRVLTADDSTRADAIGNLHAAGVVPATVELLIDAEEEEALRALLVGFLREIQSGKPDKEGLGRREADPVFPPWVTSGLVRPLHLVATEDEDAPRAPDGLLFTLVFARGLHDPGGDGGSLLAFPDAEALGPPAATGEDVAIGLAGRFWARELGLHGVVHGEVVEVNRLCGAHLRGRGRHLSLLL